MTQGKERKLVHQIRCGRIKAAVFENHANSWCWYTVRIGRHYQTKQEDYREASTYSLTDLEQVAPTAAFAESWLRCDVFGEEL